MPLTDVNKIKCPECKSEDITKPGTFLIMGDKKRYELTCSSCHKKFNYDTIGVIVESKDLWVQCGSVMYQQ
jgi:transposase-like protein